MNGLRKIARKAHICLTWELFELFREKKAEKQAFFEEKTEM